MDFKPFGKIARLSRDIIITEKIDGTNAQIAISDDMSPITLKSGRVVPFMCGSRNRWVFPENDNMGFANWAYQNTDELLKLGPGSHFGEWWGCKIQRGYGLKEKRFSLFNVSRWNKETLPSCCCVVPTLYTGPFTTRAVDECLSTLVYAGSHAALNFPDPEGIIIFHTAGGYLFKKTIKDDEKPKGIK